LKPSRSIIAAGCAAFAGLWLSGCAASEPDEQQAQPPVLVKSLWEDATGAKAPVDSIWQELRKALSRRTDLSISDKDQGDDERSSRRGPPGGGGQGGGPGGDMGGGMGGGPGGDMGGGGGPGGGMGGGPGGGSSQDRPQMPALRLFVAASVEKWPSAAEQTIEADGANAKFHQGADSSAPNADLRISLRLVSKATGRVVWKKTESCSQGQSYASCRENYIHDMAEDVAQAALDLARRAANPTPPPRRD
jgi:hypothetical protein